MLQQQCHSLYLTLARCSGRISVERKEGMKETSWMKGRREREQGKVKNRTEMGVKKEREDERFYSHLSPCQLSQ